jgi:diguanylate cyclase (GGDEF)-like protein
MQSWLSPPTTLSQQLVSALSVALLLIMGTIVGGTYCLVQNNLESKAQIHAHTLVEGLQNTVNHQKDVDISILQTLVERYAELPKISELTLVDRHGDILLHSKGQWRSQPYGSLHPQINTTLQAMQVPWRSQGQSFHLHLRDRGKITLVHIAPLWFPQVASDRPLTAIVILDLQQLREDVRQIFGLMMGITIGGSILMIIMLWFLLQGIVLRPLDLLRQGMLRSLQSNSFDLEPINPTLEIWSLATTFAYVFSQRQRIEAALLDSRQRESLKAEQLGVALAQLRERSQELEESQALLEQRVQERTAELTHALMELQSAQVQVLEREERLRYDAYHDRLTGLPNRDYLMEQLELAIRQSQSYPDSSAYAVLFIDLDGFKVVNDSLGHLMGDQLLQQVADRLSRGLRDQDVLARLGGDEFVILLPNLEDCDYAAVVAKRLQERLETPFYLQGREVFTGASIGITYSTAGYQHPEEVLRDADIAMYVSKRLGKGRYTLFNTTMQEQANDRLYWENELRRAIHQGEFCLYYQPILDLKQGNIVALEALVRWQHPHQGLLMPDLFISLASETGLLPDVEQWVLTQACSQVQQWRTTLDLPHLSLHVNVEAQLSQAEIEPYFVNLLMTTGLPGSALQLEVSESFLVSADRSNTTVIQNLKGLDIKICVDDFGMGYSSLQNLQFLKIDTLKIDRTFIQSLTQESQEVGMVQAIIALAQSTHRTVIAEGIETFQQLQILQSLGCVLGQGLFFSAPVPGNLIPNMLSQGEGLSHTHGVTFSP